METRIIISGGGTGGHIFPAIAIADALKREMPDCNILFVGAKGRMEMERVPAAGYEIIGLPVAGFQRRLTWKNVTFLFKLASSMLQARKIVRQFKPHLAVGVGGYASGPVLKAAASAGIPTLLQEQNSFPGVTNRILAKRAAAICVAYPSMERYFPAGKIIFTGNPIRSNLLKTVSFAEAYSHFGLREGIKTILVVGGSLGAGSINNGIRTNIALLKDQPVQMIWQTGKYYYEDIKAFLSPLALSNVVAMPFVQRMDLAYAIADVVISRAGAGTISELALLGKASVLVPSPNVSEDHQTKNAMALVNEDAAFLIRDTDAAAKLLPETLQLLKDDSKLESLKLNIRNFSRPNADTDIAREAIRLTGKA
jgi:UDP-N-acetylglucosamine--N-acetylmuramyl-(pentapeptide) pyrophosphoryl-undecaprenol N-acetylglucosamine transferase